MQFIINVLTQTVIRAHLSLWIAEIEFQLLCRQWTQKSTMPANLSGMLSEDFNSKCFTAERRTVQPISVRPAGRRSECQLPVGTEAQSSVAGSLQYITIGTCSLRRRRMYCRPAIVSCKFKVFAFIVTHKWTTLFLKQVWDWKYYY